MRIVLVASGLIAATSARADVSTVRFDLPAISQTSESTFVMQWFGVVGSWSRESVAGELAIDYSRAFGGNGIIFTARAGGLLEIANGEAWQLHVPVLAGVSIGAFDSSGREYKYSELHAMLRVASGLELTRGALSVRLLLEGTSAVLGQATLSVGFRFGLPPSSSSDATPSSDPAIPLP